VLAAGRRTARDGRPGKIGVLVSNTECRIVDPATGLDLGPDGTIDAIPKSPSGKILRRLLVECERGRTNAG
jgi:acyl-CoA synthetase (AMP-forming)/AMP-acid ligase II